MMEDKVKKAAAKNKKKRQKKPIVKEGIVNTGSKDYNKKVLYCGNLN
jgi:hypothetical protein